MLSGIILAHLIFSFTPHLSEYGVIGCASTEAPSNNSQTLTPLAKLSPSPDIENKVNSYSDCKFRVELDKK